MVISMLDRLETQNVLRVEKLSPQSFLFSLVQEVETFTFQERIS